MADFCGARLAEPRWRFALGALLAAALPLALYCWTMPRTVTFEDDGLFLINGVFLGVEHPPGYPVFTLLHHLLQQLPWWTPAVKGHLLSALFGAGACAMLYLTAARLGAGPMAALFGALLFAVTEHFWSQAIITEVYTFHCFLLLGAAYAALRARERPDAWRRWLWAGLCGGLALSNVWALTLLAAPAFVVLLWPLWSQTPWRGRLAGGAALLGAPLLAYGWLYWYGMTGPDFSFAGPYADFPDFVSYVTRAYYRNVDIGAGWGLTDYFRYSGWLLQEAGRQTAGLGLALAALGGLWLYGPRRLGWDGDGDRRLLFWFTLVLLLGNSLALLALWRNDYSDWMVAVFRPFPLVFYATICLWAAVGAAWCRDRLAGRLAGWRRRLAWSGLALAGAAALAYGMADDWSETNRRGHDFAQRFARHELDILPADAVYVVGGDAAFPAAYEHFVGGYRPDVRIAHPLGLLYATNYFRLGAYGGYIGAHGMVSEALLRHAVDLEDRPVTFHFEAAVGGIYDYEHWGAFLRYAPLPEADDEEYAGSAEPRRSVALDPAARATLDRHGEWLAAAQPDEVTGAIYVSDRYVAYCAGLAGLRVSLDPAVRQYGQERARQHEDVPACAAGLAFVTLYYGASRLADETGEPGARPLPDGFDPEQVAGWLDRAESEATAVPSLGRRVALLNARGQLALLSGDYEAAQEYFAQSGGEHFAADNFALVFIEALELSPWALGEPAAGQ